MERRVELSPMIYRLDRRHRQETLLWVVTGFTSADIYRWLRRKEKETLHVPYHRALGKRFLVQLVRKKGEKRFLPTEMPDHY